jgi:hypothetical protein
VSARPALLHITAAMLTDKGACSDQVALFKRTFPKGAKPTALNLAKARSAGLDYGYITAFLSAPHLAAYEAARDAHLAAYKAACAPHLAAYKAACDASLSEAFAAQGVA